MDNEDNRTLESGDKLTVKEKAALKREMRKLEGVLDNHDCLLASEGYCPCAKVYMKLNELEMELRFRG